MDSSLALQTGGLGYCSLDLIRRSHGSQMRSVDPSPHTDLPELVLVGVILDL
jgi:hypothetical protein